MRSTYKGLTLDDIKEAAEYCEKMKLKELAEYKSQLEWMEEDMREGLYLSDDEMDDMEMLRKLIKERE